MIRRLAVVLVAVSLPAAAHADVAIEGGVDGFRKIYLEIGAARSGANPSVATGRDVRDPFISHMFGARIARTERVAPRKIAGLGGRLGALQRAHADVRGNARNGFGVWGIRREATRALALGNVKVKETRNLRAAAPGTGQTYAAKGTRPTLRSRGTASTGRPAVARAQQNARRPVGPRTTGAPARAQGPRSQATRPQGRPQARNEARGSDRGQVRQTPGPSGRGARR